MAPRLLATRGERRAVTLAYFDDFWPIAVPTFALACQVPLMGRSIAETEEHIGAE